MLTNPKINNYITFLLSLPRWLKKLIVLLFDIAACVISTWLVFCFRLNEIVTVNNTIVFTSILGVVLFLPIFISAGVYKTIFRFSELFTKVVTIKAASSYALLYIVFIIFVGIEGVPRSIGVAQPILFFSVLYSSRLIAKFLLNSLAFKKACKVLIYGAGSAGRQIASGLAYSSEFDPVGFVDDDPTLWGGSVAGLSVYPPSRIPNLINSKDISEIFLAIPSASRYHQKKIIAELSDLPLHIRTLPSLSNLANGVVKIQDMQEVKIDDVLGRDPIIPYEHLLSENVKDKVILVTGAGGSIGSELCRQIAKLRPKKLVLFELNEFALYKLEHELTEIKGLVEIIPILGNVLDKEKLERVFRQYYVHTVFHAAAYKHVPMIEMNPAAGILNNVFGTLHAVETACKVGIETFVLISTDKAVRPTNIMGCSKRISELILQAKNSQNAQLGDNKTKLTMVRFGNVLGSSGSVLPLFYDQIKKGGPVKVTHPEVIRFFMTIPEAAQLVIQASTLGNGGDVMLLDMGDPVSILSLAKRMIHLSGFSVKDENNPNGDIEIKYIGLRPGEKLYEELLLSGESVATIHPRIMRASEGYIKWEALLPILKRLERAVQSENIEVIESLLKKLVPEFSRPF